LAEKNPHLLFLFSLSILLVPRSQPVNEDDDPICIQPAISSLQPTSDSHVQWIGLREHLQETVVFTWKILKKYFAHVCRSFPLTTGGDTFQADESKLRD
jgi:hypothetical protein